MANTILRTPNGNIQAVPAGTIAVKAEPTPTTSSCVNSNPELYLTVTGGSGTIVWCGETWNLPGDSGVEKGPVCPTGYFNKTDNPTTTTIVQAGNVWNYNGTGVNTGLILYRRQLAVVSLGTPNLYYLLSNGWSNGFVVISNFTNAVLVSYGGPASFVPRPITVVSTNTFGPTSKTADVKVGVPRPGAYQLPASMTENNLTIGGINYAWRRGNGW